MKRFLMYIILASLSVTGFSQNKVTCMSYVYDFDVPKEIMRMPVKNRALFWADRHIYDKKIDKVFSAETKAAKKSISEYADVITVIKGNVKVDEVCDEKYRDIIKKINEVFKLGNIDPNLEVHVFNDNEVNAGTYPTGFIFLNTGLIEKLDTTEIIAVVAHELEHFIAKHSLNQIYATKMKERNNKLFAEIAGAVAATAYAYAGSQGAISNSQYTQNVILASGAFERDAAISTNRFKMRYSREQEIECDLAAYRFLQFIGEDPLTMVRVLEKLEQIEGDRKTSKYDDHPDAKYRKKILLVLNEKEQRDKEKEKRKVK